MAWIIKRVSPYRGEDPKYYGAMNEDEWTRARSRANHFDTKERAQKSVDYLQKRFDLNGLNFHLVIEEA